MHHIFSLGRSKSVASETSSITSTAFANKWSNRISALNTPSQVAAFLHLLTSIDRADESDDVRSPAEGRYLEVENWAVTSLLSRLLQEVEHREGHTLEDLIRLPFPEATDAAALLRRPIRVPFWGLFNAAGLFEGLVAQLMKLPRDRRREDVDTDLASPLAEVLTNLLATPWNNKVHCTEIANALLEWESDGRTIEVDYVPPRVLFFELLQICVKPWIVESARHHASHLRKEALQVAAQLAISEDSKPSSPMATPRESQAPSSSAESSEGGAASLVYRRMSEALDKQRLKIDQLQQLTNLLLVVDRLEKWAAKREEEDAALREEMLPNWLNKVRKGAKAFQSLKLPGAKQIEAECQSRMKAQEVVIMESMGALKQQKQEMALRREELTNRVSELSLELLRLQTEISAVTEEERSLAERLCNDVARLHDLENQTRNEMDSRLDNITGQEAVANDFHVLDNLTSKLSQTFSTPANEAEVSVTDSKMTVEESIRTLLHKELPAHFATQRAFIQYCCDKLGSQKTSQTTGRQKATLYRPVLAQTVLTIDRLAKHAEVASQLIYADEKKAKEERESATAEYQSCKALIADNLAMIF